MHRVQRVPQTDAQGRLHTSTVSVAVMPLASEAGADDAGLNPSELKIETMRGSGAGGQHVNTTNSAVRVTHLPTGVSVHIGNERSQVRFAGCALCAKKARGLEHVLYFHIFLYF